MKIFLSADIEGTAGIARWDETRQGNPAYSYFQEQMSQEVAAACRGALAGGAKEVVVKDAHGSACNIIPNLLPEKTRLTRGWQLSPMLMMETLDSSFAGVVFTGYHSASNRDGNPLAHTISSSKVGCLRINGVKASEFLINAYTAAYFGVPVCFLSGDAQLCEEAQAQVPGITTVSTMVGTGGSSCSIHPAEATRLIEKQVQLAVEQCHNLTPILLPENFTVNIRFKDFSLGYKAGFYPGASRADEKSIRFETDDYMEVLRLLLFTLI